MRHDVCSGWGAVRVRVWSRLKETARATAAAGAAEEQSRAPERARTGQGSACGSKQKNNEREWEVSDSPTNRPPPLCSLPLPLLLLAGLSRGFWRAFFALFDACDERISRLLTKIRRRAHEARPICAISTQNACEKRAIARFHSYEGLDWANRAQQLKKNEKNRMIS